MFADRVLSGMRATGALHLGHYHGVLKNWVELQNKYPCFFFVADWHALTTHYDDTANINEHTFQMLVDWLAAGVDPNQATIFVQSKVNYHAELFLLLSMGTPLSWLERVPTYRDQIEKLKEKDLDTYGFLGYPLLQAADILLYKAVWVPVGEDQVPHIEMTREVARRFNHLYGKHADFEEKALAVVKKLGSKQAKYYIELRTQFHEKGDREALEHAHAILEESQNLSVFEQELLFSYLQGQRKIILPEPQALLTKSAKMPGLDGQKMSKSYGNTIALREQPASVEQKIKTMPTDPARIRRHDAGNPKNCPVWQLHQIYTPEEKHTWIVEGCTEAKIGCIECKKPLIQAVIQEQAIFFERAQVYLDDPSLVESIISDGCEKAKKIAQETMEEVREVMGL
jgi:tryptophanyl-tRNA synthetase